MWVHAFCSYIQMTDFDHVGARVQCDLVVLDVNLLPGGSEQAGLSMQLDSVLKL